MDPGDDIIGKARVKLLHSLVMGEGGVGWGFNAFMFTCIKLIQTDILCVLWDVYSTPFLLYFLVFPGPFSASSWFLSSLFWLLMTLIILSSCTIPIGGRNLSTLGGYCTRYSCISSLVHNI